MRIDYQIAFWSLLAVLGLGWLGSMEARLWRSPAASQADAWLFQPTNIADGAGVQLSRAGLLDSVISSNVTSPPPPPDEGGGDDAP